MFNSLKCKSNTKVLYFVPNACDKLKLKEYILYFCFFKR